MDKTVDEWIRKFKKQGVEGLKTKPQKGNNRLLSIKQKQEIKKIINTKTPQEVGLTGRFWNVILLKRYVKQKYGIVYRSLVSYRNLFAYCGFTTSDVVLHIISLIKLIKNNLPICVKDLRTL
jgi:transposase